MPTFLITALATTIAAAAPEAPTAESAAPPIPAQTAPVAAEGMGGPFEPLALDPVVIVYPDQTLLVAIGLDPAGKFMGLIGPDKVSP